MHTIFRNKCVNEIRSNQSNPVTDSLEELIHLPDKGQDILKKIDVKERLNETLALLNKLCLKCKDILMLTAKGFSSTEIAQKLGYKDDNTVNVLRKRCRKNLFQQMG